MAKIALAIGGAIAGAAISVATGGLGAFPVGAWLTDIVAGASVGLSVGGAIGQVAFPNRQKLQMPIQDLQVSSSADGAPIAFGYANNRFAGQVIWAPNITFVKQKEPGGGSGGGPTSFNFAYYGSFAAAFGEGPGTIRRIWFDSKIVYKAPGGTPGNFEPLGDLPNWDPTVAYSVDDIVATSVTDPATGDGILFVYQCIFPNTGIPPQGNSLYWESTSEYPAWQRDVVYQPGSLIDYFGQVYAESRPQQGSPPPGHGWVPLADYYAPPTIYPGDENQLPDPTIQGAEGVANTPAYRGLIYAVWENFPLANFGNRIPNIRAEVNFPLGHNV